MSATPKPARTSPREATRLLQLATTFGSKPAARHSDRTCLAKALANSEWVGDRFAALNGGRLSEAVPVAGLTVEQVGLMLGGAHGMEAVRAA